MSGVDALSAAAKEGLQAFAIVIEPRSDICAGLNMLREAGMGDMIPGEIAEDVKGKGSK